MSIVKNLVEETVKSLEISVVQEASTFVDNLLMEDGFDLLMEDGSLFILEGV